MNRNSRYSRLSTVALLFAAMSFFADGVRADIVWLRGQSEPVYGIVREVGDSQLTLDEWVGTDKFSERRLSMSDIESYLVNVDPTRLERLNPANPSGYLEYAEELATQRRDPVAQGLCVRLYLIAAKHSSADERRSAICGLLATARSEEEQKQLVQIAELYDVQPRTVKPDSEVVASEPSDQRSLLEALQKLRRGDSVAAVESLRNPELQELVHGFLGGLDANELVRWAGMDQLSGRQLAQLLSMERALELSENGGLTLGSTSRWGTESTRSIQSITKIPNLENVTEFDPSKSVFRNRNWQKPD